MLTGDAEVARGEPATSEVDAVDSWRWNALTASLIRGAPAAYPSVNRTARPCSSRSLGRGAGGIAGPASAALLTVTASSPCASRPANTAAERASRYVARASVGSTVSSSRAAASRSGVAVLPRRNANAICPRSRWTWART